VRLPVSGSYLTNTSENHSEIHGPHSAWRRALTARVNRGGRPMDAALAARFGLDLDQIRAASDAFFRADGPQSDRQSAEEPRGRCRLKERSARR
jgi:hypothetical protein